MITKQITIDLWKPTREPIAINQYESEGRTLDIALTAGSLPVNVLGAEVVFYAKKTDGTIVFNDCTIEDGANGKVSYLITGQTCILSGELDCFIMIVKSGPQVVRTQTFKITVKPSDDVTEAVESQSEFTALEIALATLAGLLPSRSLVQDENGLHLVGDEDEPDDCKFYGMMGGAKGFYEPCSSDWKPLSGVSFTSVDNPTGVIDVPSGHGVTESMKLKFDNGGNTIYGKVTKSEATQLTFCHEINPGTNQALTIMQNSAITNFYYSSAAAPQDFPVDPDKWTIIIKDASSRSQSNPTQNVWYNNGSISLPVPIGHWIVSYLAAPRATMLSTAGVSANITLSTANNSESDSDFTACIESSGATGTIATAQSMFRSKPIKRETKALYYLNVSTPTSGALNVEVRGDRSKTILRAVLAY